jgi:hypothetical protein
MVCKRSMGLLDEAIREHLELKRRRGADPAEVAREQHEALDPVSAPAPAGQPAASALEQAPGEDAPTEEHALDGEALDSRDADAASVASSLAQPETAAAGAAAPAAPVEPDETAELDMSTVLDAGPADQLRPASPGSVGAGGNAPSGERVQLEQGPGDAAGGPESA